MAVIHFLQVPFSVFTFWFLCFMLEVFFRCLVIFGHLLLFKLIGSFDGAEKDLLGAVLDIPSCLSLWAGQIPQVSLLQSPRGMVKGRLTSSRSRDRGGQKFQHPVLTPNPVFWYPCPQVCLVSSRPEKPPPAPQVFPLQRINLQSFAVVGQVVARVFRSLTAS